MIDKTSYSVHDLAARWGCSQQAVYDMLRSGTIHGFKIGSMWRIKLAEIEAWESGFASEDLPEITSDNPAKFR